MMKNLLLTIGLITLISAHLSAFASSMDMPSTASTSISLPADIEQQQLITLQQNSSSFLLLDVRSKEEFDEGHIPGAINIAHSDIAQHTQTLNSYLDKPIVVYCRSGKRAGFAIDELKALGFKQLHHLKGDMQGWQKSELTIAH